MEDSRTHLYKETGPYKWPIVYRPEYNVSFMGMEKWHPFDAGKWGRIHSLLQGECMCLDDSAIEPNEVTKEDLLMVHSKRYLKSLKFSFIVAVIAEVLPLCLVPNYFVQRNFLRPMRFQTGGSILAGKLALDHGWAINLGGGFHHSSANSGGGFCVYADITLMIHFLFKFFPETVKKVMIVDVDAHQGNGYARDFKDNDNVYILDIYNKDIYPRDTRAKNYINKKVEVQRSIREDQYLEKLSDGLDEALNEFTPDLVVYNAGTDVIYCDPLGALQFSTRGIILRDEIVFREIRSRNIPIVMLTSGGYTYASAGSTASSILNLYTRDLIHRPSGIK